MSRKMQTFGVAAMLATLTLATAPLAAQAAATEPDPLIGSAADAAGFFKDMFTKAAEQMSEEDYAFKPTPEVRSFGQILAHVADSNYWFCASVKGEKPRADDLEKTKTTRADIQKALAESFAYCDGAYAGMTEAKAKTMLPFRGKPRPALALLLFRTHHAALHYGNVITYMRLRGKVPPSSQVEPEG